ncbi:INO80 complex subunit C-like [Tubulanus polymorphus]|uniref:INO80 complex subunit C-like n=1 Tax=Tubulanus polymorphus TaxID=672921 RepID=UPI003DA1C9BA
MSTTPSNSSKRKTPSRSGSPAAAAAGAGAGAGAILNPSKRLKKSDNDIEETSETLVASVLEETAASGESEPLYCFKDRNFVHSAKENAGMRKSRVWKNLKQIIALERQTRNTDEPTYGSLDAIPSLNKPARKYSDITGLRALYTDPQTKLRYTTIDEFTRIRTLPVDIITGYLTLRKANTPVP